MKKTLGSVFVALLLLTLVAGAVFAASTAKEKMNFNGTYQAVNKDEINLPIVYVHSNGSGDAKNLGPYTLHFEGIVNAVNGVGTSVLAEHLTMANGDIIFAVGTGKGVASSTPGVNQVVDHFTITGGTGQFENASGEYTVKRLFSPSTGVSSGTIEGEVKLSKK